MAGSTKYTPIRELLAAQADDEVTFTFAEVERALGSQLPISARQYPAWWANQNPPSAQSQSWTSAGWQAFASLKSERVTFRRTKAKAKPSGAVAEAAAVASAADSAQTQEHLQEDNAKEQVRRHLEQQGWRTTVRAGKAHGIDIEAFRPGERWIIEVKGSHSRNPVNVTYFLSVIGELLQRMNDPNAKYSLAFPDVPQFRGLWERLPKLAKERTGITCLFVGANGSVAEVD